MEKKDAKRQRNDQTKLVEFFFWIFLVKQITARKEKKKKSPESLKKEKERAGYGYKNLICIDTHTSKTWE